MILSDRRGVSMLKGSTIKSLFFVIVTLLFLATCAKADRQDVDRHIIFLVDFSGSVEHNIENYWKTIELVTGCSQDMKIKETKICNKIRPKDMITIFKITGQSRRNADIIADIYLKEKSWLENKLKYGKRTVPVKKSFRDRIKEAFSNPVLAKNTEILAAIRLSQQYFETAGGKKKILIILSDMIEESEFYNFAKMKVQPEQILEKEEKAGRLPNLAGITVYISGASANSSKKFDEIEKFWLAYFEKTGASFASRDYYSSELLGFSE